MARFLVRWGLFEGITVAALARALNDSHATVETAWDNTAPQPAPDDPVRIPAQWEPVETVILSWPVLYPPLWEQFARMVEAIAPAAEVTVNIPAPMWGDAIWLYLRRRERTGLERVRFLHLPTDDIWVRDYGPTVGPDSQGRQVVVGGIFDPLPAYPQARDDAMPRLWAAHGALPYRPLDLHTEGGNLWSDGAGTLIMSEHVLRRNPYLTHSHLEVRLRRVFAFDKLIMTPKLDYEETGHIDLLLKLADAQTVLVTRPAGLVNRANLQAAQALFRRETNARGQPYHVVELPNLPPYLNWGLWPVWRSYTNALTVNGRVLVPVYSVPQDDDALLIYERALPGYQVIPIDSRVSINGGGAVHCLTKEIHRLTL